MSTVQALKEKTHYAGRFFGDYKEKFNKLVSEVIAVRIEGEAPSVECRKTIINAMTDAYIEQTSETPDGVQVQRLANWLLLEEMTDNHPDKVSRQDYPFMTKRQLRTRHFRERADERIPETHTTTQYLGGKKQPYYKVKNDD